MDTLANLSRKLAGAEDLHSVVRSMKAMAASNIGQYETALLSLGDYYHTVALGLVAYFSGSKPNVQEPESAQPGVPLNGIIVFGSDQGLVGQFNDSLAGFVAESLADLPGKKEIWAVGERVQLLLTDLGFSATQLFSVPQSVNAITPLVGQLLMNCEEHMERGSLNTFYLFHNQPKPDAGYQAVKHRLLPLDKEWKQTITELKWPTKLPPQVAGGMSDTLHGLIHQYLLISIFKACAESLASENASRLAAMQRAEKNIEELLDDLKHKFHSLRQGLIDEELFDIISGFEALKTP